MADVLLKRSCRVTSLSFHRCPIASIGTSVSLAPALWLPTCAASVPGPAAQALDWLGRVEQFEEDVVELFQLLNARPGMPQLPMEPQRRTNIALPARCTPRRRSRLLLGGGDDDSGSGSGHNSGDSSKSGSGGSVGLTFQLHNSTFVPCDDLDYFRCAARNSGHLHCTVAELLPPHRAAMGCPPHPDHRLLNVQQGWPPCLHTRPPLATAGVRTPTATTI